ncbi:tRNA pseudouridine(38-40) synthase TruA [Flammeovirga pectinis]|uniref:tRNA pseudouridine synthase A n=1 Tax=Flammeovirga pectinis TaxID=2494373 RepID=A0A3S9PA19_9BACT|nr:tRNA pseudouridine(38-40) synthase TruA [Flammeovirga pectinis]AZQ64932.1 tRNA pseudouridine(38-40) synthase TruA [Flammeovirga pectinis]
MRYFIHLAYDGTNYRGWQFQPNVVSVQGTIEDRLKSIFKTDITVFGCGRTDAGVHSSQYFIHINLAEPLTFDLKFRLNKNLPEAIVVYDVIPMNDDQHVRFDATMRTYDYFIHTEKDILNSKFSSNYDVTALDIDVVQKAAKMLTSFDDFIGVCKKPHLYKHTRCNVTHAEVFVDREAKRLRFTITANRFLRGMIRLIVTNLLNVGKGRITLEEFEKVFTNKVTIIDTPPAYPSGLFLSKVEYPYLKMESKSGLLAGLKLGLQ